MAARGWPVEGNCFCHDVGKGKRYAFQTIFFHKPGQDFRVPQVKLPGTLETVMAEKPSYAFLKEMKRDDVTIYDAHPIYNNTRAAGSPLQLSKGVGPDLMLGKVLGDHFAEPMFLMRLATTNTNPLSPALRSGPTAVSGATRESKFLAVSLPVGKSPRFPENKTTRDFPAIPPTPSPAHVRTRLCLRPKFSFGLVLPESADRLNPESLLPSEIIHL